MPDPLHERARELLARTEGQMRAGIPELRAVLAEVLEDRERLRHVLDEITSHKVDDEPSLAAQAARAALAADDARGGA